MEQNYECIVVGTSAGGMEALSWITSRLPTNFSCPIIMLQHIQEHSENYLIQYLQTKTNLRVIEADEKQEIRKGHIYIAPSGYHLLVEADRTFSLSVDKKENFSRPSIDVLFETAADVFQEHLIGIVLTGANADGSHGLKKIQDAGGLCLIQSPETASFPYMPLSASKIVDSAYILDLNEIVDLLSELNGM
ncbi:MAG: chemotaxis protein CheB [Leptospiraceae bacterium]|nr:chemotaxis protein CheB [Leptospiraceae bacterium]MCP5495694.1 chemotaxis protein CheB [Leptospiraceae bacterium]